MIIEGRETNKSCLVVRTTVVRGTYHAGLSGEPNGQVLLQGTDGGLGNLATRRVEDVVWSERVSWRT